jgi:hypothetical protein
VVPTANSEINASKNAAVGYLNILRSIRHQHEAMATSKGAPDAEWESPVKVRRLH